MEANQLMCFVQSDKESWYSVSVFLLWALDNLEAPLSPVLLSEISRLSGCWKKSVHPITQSTYSRL